MSRFNSTPRPVYSRWGVVEYATEIGPGVWWVSTPSHGGFVLSDERVAAMPMRLRASGNEFEEDCEAALVVVAFPDLFAEQHVEEARDALRGFARTFSGAAGQRYAKACEGL